MGTDSMQHARLDAATRHLPAPLAVVDLEAFDANAADLVRRAGGTPIRVASKSVRCRALLRRVLDRPGYAGVLAYSLAEALWLAGDGPDAVRRRRRGLPDRRPGLAAPARRRPAPRRPGHPHGRLAVSSCG